MVQGRWARIRSAAPYAELNVGSVYVGYNGTGTFSQTSGAVTINNNFLDVGRFTAGAGDLQLDRRLVDCRGRVHRR